MLGSSNGTMYGLLLNISNDPILEARRISSVLLFMVREGVYMTLKSSGVSLCMLHVHYIFTYKCAVVTHSVSYRCYILLINACSEIYSISAPRY